MRHSISLSVGSLGSRSRSRSSPQHLPGHRPAARRRLHAGPGIGRASVAILAGGLLGSGRPRAARRGAGPAREVGCHRRGGRVVARVRTADLRFATARRVRQDRAVRGTEPSDLRIAPSQTEDSRPTPCSSSTLAVPPASTDRRRPRPDNDRISGPRADFAPAAPTLADDGRPDQATAEGVQRDHLTDWAAARPTTAPGDVPALSPCVLFAADIRSSSPTLSRVFPADAAETLNPSSINRGNSCGGLRADRRLAPPLAPRATGRVHPAAHMSTRRPRAARSGSSSRCSCWSP